MDPKSEMSGRQWEQFENAIRVVAFERAMSGARDKKSWDWLIEYGLRRTHGMAHKGGVVHPITESLRAELKKLAALNVKRGQKRAEEVMNMKKGNQP